MTLSVLHWINGTSMGTPERILNVAREENLQYAQALEHAAFEVIQKFLKRIGYSG